mmetsp:Transcript_29351/g.38609  ORF Transcript_29351/g.38609 Transcript_29351/m.38609 type:complete len:194 (+) Transcript_29351:84-665(+)
MFLLDWVYDMLTYWGFLKKNAKILFLGLDNAGKTTLINFLDTDRIAAYPPTILPYNHEVNVGNLRMKAFDIGGHESARRLWKDYITTVDAIVFLVDTADRERFNEARMELDALLTLEAPEKTPFLVLGNKIDRPNSAPEIELRVSLGLNETYGKEKNNRIHKDFQVHPIELFMCSIVKRTGYQEGFEWLSQFL